MYGKLFAQMYDGTLATRGPWQALVTFQQLVILADLEGVVDMTADALARRTTIPLEIIEAGIRSLEEADPDSRTPTEEGRRIVRLSDSRPWGWRIVNYAHYRKLRTADERREYHRQYAQNRRHPDTVDSQQSQPPQQIQQKSRKSTNSSKQDVDVEAVKETTIDPNGPIRSTASGESQPWPVEGATLWSDAVGPITPPRFGRAMKPVVLKYGWPEAKSALLTYIELNEGRTRKVEWFAGDAVRWVNLAKMPCVDPVTRELTEKGRMAYNG